MLYSDTFYDCHVSLLLLPWKYRQVFDYMVESETHHFRPWTEMVHPYNASPHHGIPTDAFVHTVQTEVIPLSCFYSRYLEYSVGFSLCYGMSQCCWYF